MRLHTRSILSVLVLLTFIPATIGYAFFKHSCSGCHYSKVATALAVLLHTEDDHECYCVEDCESEDHEHGCDLDLKKIELPYTSEDDYIKVVVPFNSIDDAIFASLYNLSGEYCDYTSIGDQRRAFPISGQSLLVKNCVFRL